MRKLLALAAIAWTAYGIYKIIQWTNDLDREVGATANNWYDQPPYRGPGAR